MDEYYLQQSGSGIGSFAGLRYQRGDGFFGRLISGTVLPLVKKVLPFLGRTAMDAGVGVMQDWQKGEKVGQSIKNRLNEGVDKVTNKLEEKVKQITGSGKRKRGKSSSRAKKINTSATKSRQPKKRRRSAIDFL